MNQERPKVFISAVTSEFGRARDKVRSDFSARGCTVTVQSDFQQDPDSDTLLGTLANYIRDCNAVVCVIGKRSGACPPARAAARFPGVLPPGLKEASYTQWEFFLARHYKRRTYTYIAGDDYKPDRDKVAGDRADLQGAYLDFLKADGVHYTEFATAEELRIAVLRDEPKIVAPLEPESAARRKPIVLPYPSIGNLFKGRDDFMRRLHASLTRSHGARTAIVSSALYGLGGIGKTRVAVEYAWAHADDYNALLFAVAETPEALRRNLAAVAGILLPQLDTTDDTVRLATVLNWLKANPGWFLILDNVDSKDALAEVERVLRDLAGGHLVVTSRLANFSGHFQPLQLDVLAINAAATFLLERTKDRRRPQADDEAKAREIAEELGGLAIALEQAAAFVAKRRLTFAQYLDEWRSKRDDVLKWWDATVTDYPRSVAVTWQTSVAQLSDGGRRLLERLAWLAPEKVPESLLDVPVPGAEAEDVHAAYDDLATYSLVTPDAEGPFFLVHRLVQDVTRRNLSGDERRKRLFETLSWIDAAFIGTPDDVRDWPILDPLAPHARSVVEFYDGQGISTRAASIMNTLGSLLEAKALHAEAEPLLRRALAVREAALGPNHPDVATDLNNVAALLMETNRLEEAEPLMRRALAISEETLGQDHSELAIRLNNLAHLLRSTGRLMEAEPLMRRALAMDERNLGPDHPRVAIRLNNLAALLAGTARHREAEPLMHRALKIDETNFGLDHPFVAIRLNNLATLLQSTHRSMEAELLLRRALAINEKSLGPDHPDVAIRLNNLAAVLKGTGRLSEAEPLMRRQVAILVKFTRRTGYNHPRLDAAVSNYTNLLKAMGKSQAEIDAACAELMRPLAGMASASATATEGDRPKGGGRGA